MQKQWKADRSRGRKEGWGKYGQAETMKRKKAGRKRKRLPVTSTKTQTQNTRPSRHASIEFREMKPEPERAAIWFVYCMRDSTATRA
jgi:hypothetical protein